MGKSPNLQALLIMGPAGAPPLALLKDSLLIPYRADSMEELILGLDRPEENRH